MGDQLQDFIDLTGVDAPIGRQLLDITGGDLPQAVHLFYDTDMAETLRRQNINTSTSTPAAPAAAASASTPAAAASSSTRTGRIGRQDPNGVIHIDSDDDDDNNAAPADHHSIESDDVQVVDSLMTDAATVARTAQEEEDMAIARRIQEEMYSEAPAAAADGIRSPMGRTTEVLVEPSYGDGVYSGYGGFTGHSIYEQMRPAGGRDNPFNQVWGEDTDLADTGLASSAERAPTSRQARLADLFRPPYELIERMTWDEARSIGRAEKRWILANIQDMSDFQCQALNRDIWKDEAIRQLVQENFIFLQYNKDDPSAESYIQYYMPGGQHENPDNYPHVAIVDPRTGEQVKVWAGRPFPSALDFHSQLVEFLDRYSLDSTKKNPVQRQKPRQPAKDVGRMTEEEMLEMALQNSLASAGGEDNGAGSGSGSGSSSRPSIQDPDELTAAHPGDPGKGKEKAVDDEETEEDRARAVFARIASDRPHEEPANSPTTTRIQLRHPTGRVIRRFAVSDPVQRIYEWLKAAPLEGRDGVAFELKAVPQGHDLLQDLDKTIEEAGLKQATVVIEFDE